MTTQITTRVLRPDGGSLEVSEGVAPSSLEISMSAKGFYTYTVKVYMAEGTPDQLEAALASVRTFDAAFRAAFPNPAGPWTDPLPATELPY